LLTNLPGLSYHRWIIGLPAGLVSDQSSTGVADPQRMKL